MVNWNSSGWKDGDERVVKDRMKQSYEASLSKWQGWWLQANIDRRYSVGDQRYLNYFANPYYKEQKFVFNIIHSKIEQIVGVQRRDRKSSVVVNNSWGSDQTASQLTKCLMWVFQRDNTLENISTAFYNASVTGLNLMHVYRDDKNDPFSGDIRTKNFASASFIMDPWWTEFDLSDCAFIWTRDYCNLFQLQTMMPDRAEELEQLKKYKQDNNSDIRFTFMPEAYQAKYRSKQNYALDMFYYIDERERTMIHHLGTRQAAELPKHIEVEEFMMSVDEEEREYVEIVKQKIPSVRLSVSVCDKVMYDEHYDDVYPFVPTVFYFDPESIEYSYRFRGIPRIIRDTQYLFNRRTQIQLDTLESLPNSGVNVVEDALLDEKDAFKTGPGQVRVIKKGYMPDQAISNIQPPQVDASAFQMTENLNNLSTSLLGISEELMGMASDSDVGITQALRQGASLTTLRTPFDKLDLSQKILSERILKRIQQDFSIGKVTQILGEDPTPEFSDRVFFEYSCVVEDGLNTTTQKQMQFAQLLQLAALPKIGDLIDPMDILEASTLQDKQRIIDNMQARQQQAMQQEQMQMQAQMQQSQVQSELLMSQSDLNRQSASYKSAQAETEYSTTIQKLADAQDKMSLGEERRVEALQRLESIDMDKLHRLLDFFDRIQDRGKEDLEHAAGIANQAQGQINNQQNGGQYG